MSWCFIWRSVNKMRRDYCLSPFLSHDVYSKNEGNNGVSRMREGGGGCRRGDFVCTATCRRLVQPATGAGGGVAWRHALHLQNARPIVFVSSSRLLYGVVPALHARSSFNCPRWLCLVFLSTQSFADHSETLMTWLKVRKTQQRRSQKRNSGTCCRLKKSRDEDVRLLKNEETAFSFTLNYISSVQFSNNIYVSCKSNNSGLWRLRSCVEASDKHNWL